MAASRPISHPLVDPADADAVDPGQPGFQVSYLLEADRAVLDPGLAGASVCQSPSAAMAVEAGSTLARWSAAGEPAGWGGGPVTCIAGAASTASRRIAIQPSARSPRRGAVPAPAPDNRPDQRPAAVTWRSRRSAAVPHHYLEGWHHPGLTLRTSGGVRRAW